MSNDRAGLHKEVGFLLLLTFVGCVSTQPTAQEIIVRKNAYWGSVNEAGETGWCSERPITQEEWEIMHDCTNATPERTVKGAACPTIE